MDVAGQPLPLGLLRGDHLLGEPAVRLLARREPAVHPRLVQRPGDEAADRGEHADVAVVELPVRDGVHVEDPGQSRRLALHRHRHHRRVLLAVQLRDGDVARVGPLVAGDHHGFAVARDPARDAGVERQPHPADLRVERWRRAGEGQRALGVVEDVDEADVGRGRPGDHARDRCGERLDVRPAGRRLDDREQDLVLALRVVEAPGLRGPHRNTPSRSAAATAAVRSGTCSLRSSDRTWLLTVSSPMTSWPAIARLLSRHEQGEHLALALRQSQVRAGPELVALQARRRRRRAPGHRRVDDRRPRGGELEVADELLAAVCLSR